MLAEHQDTLNELSTSLGARLAEWAHPEAHLTVKWQQDIQKSVRLEEPFAQIVVREGNFSGNLSRFGHGLQRAYLLALLQELSNSENEGQPTLVLAIEEPELYQHPPQCQHLATILRNLAK
jgi:predicted ATP-dependent endonuclease of OLD family